MSDSLPAVSVLLSSKDRRELLRQAVASLRRLDYPRGRVEIVVVEETDTPQDPGADRYVCLPREGKGFAFSRNAALGAASHPIVAFTDDDCLIDPAWLRELVAPFGDPEIAAVAGGVRAQPSGILGKTEIVLGFPGGGLRRIAKARASENGWSPTRDLSTVNAAARRGVIEKLGGFREETGVYGGEDSELFGRLTATHRAVFNPRALVFHRARDSFSGIARWLMRRGVGEVALTHLDRRRGGRSALLFRHLKTSLLVRLGALVAAIGLLGIPLALALPVLALLYYASMVTRYRFARREMGWPVVFVTPVTKLLMDVCFDLGRLKGFALWATGKLATRVTDVQVPRILLIDNAATIVGGGQVSLLRLIERLDRARFEPLVAFPEKGALFDTIRNLGISAVILPMPSLRGLGWLATPFATFSWLVVLRRQRIDLLHANGSRAMIYAGIAGRLTRRPVLWHVRVLGDDGLLDRILVRLASRVIVNSSAVEKRFDLSERRNHVRSPIVIPNGVDLAAFAEARPDPELSRSWRLEGKHVLVVLAQLIPWKRHELAIEILSELKRRGHDVTLLLVGDEVPDTRGYRQVLERRAQELGVAEHCVFTGFRTDVPSILALADILIHTATPEPFGRALIEAMASGLPVLAAAGGGVEDVVEDGVTGRIMRVDAPSAWADGVEELLRDVALAERMGRNGRSRAEARFSIQTHVERVQQLYQEVLSA